jgi:hypothetical protein
MQKKINSPPREQGELSNSSSDEIFWRNWREGEGWI